MDAAATVGQLVTKIVDLLGEVLVLSSNRFGAIIALFELRLQSVNLGRVLSTFGVAGVQFSGDIGDLAFPVVDGFVEHALAFLGLVADGVRLRSKCVVITEIE